jgi:integrative and conjugative element protein (TIGR02256 family)
VRTEPLVLSPDGERLILVHPSVLNSVTSRIEKGTTGREAGGIFLGCYRGAHIEIFGCTEPMLLDVRTRTLFDRMDPGHQAAAISAWKCSKGTDTYVGEWHTHPEFVPKPSRLDGTTWQSQLRRLDVPLVFAIGGWKEIFWALGERGWVKQLKEIR